MSKSRVAQTSASSADFPQRQAVHHAAPGSAQPRPISCLGGSGRLSGLVSTWARASLVSDIEASLVIEASSAVTEPRGVFIWVLAFRHRSSARRAPRVAIRHFSNNFGAQITLKIRAGALTALK